VTSAVADPSPLAGLARPFVLLEDRLAPAPGGWLYRDPVEVVRCDTPLDVAAAFRRIEAGLASGLHAAGLMTYELGYALEPSLASSIPPDRGLPLLWFGLFAQPLRLDGAALDAAFAGLSPPAPITALSAGHGRAEHVEKVRRILALIAAGDLYQANLTFPMRFDYAGDPLALYAALRSAQPVAHGGLMAWEDTTVLSVSPELFVEIADGRATTRPMKGTAARGDSPAADAAARTALLADPKQRAENLMIVDLLRNDLSRLAIAGTVRTSALFAAETYPTFHALTSTVTARLRPGVGLREQMMALFPCGSIVGAPKIRAAEVIRALEADPRGAYSGAIGAIAPGGDMAFNVAIRTATIGAGGRGVYGVGGGVVADSDPGAEYEEALLKGRVLSRLAEDYGLIETFRWSASQGFVRLPDHLDRMAASALALGFRFERAKVERRLTRLAEGWRASDEDRRVRVELRRTGAVDIGRPAVAGARGAPVRLHLAHIRLDAGDPFLRHKTTRREAHEAAFAQAVALGLDEAILLNRAGRLADGSRNSLFVEKGGRLVTPPIADGALPGVLRAALIADGRAVEGALGLDDLPIGARFLVGNSLHGLRPATLVSLAPEGNNDIKISLCNS
jgi:para-aminobenzoate synthetase/4-amino-4-deoxychorismate lyase